MILHHLAILWQRAESESRFSIEKVNGLIANFPTA